MGIFRQLTATMAQPGHLEYQRTSQHAPPQQVGEGHRAEPISKIALHKSNVVARAHTSSTRRVQLFWRILALVGLVSTDHTS